MTDNASTSKGDIPPCFPQALASQALTHIVAHSLRSAGFTTASERALQTLAAALELYIGELGRRSAGNAQVCGRRVAGWDDVLAVLRDFSAVGEVTDVRRMVEREMTTANGGIRKQGGVGEVLRARARRWREVDGKIGMEVGEEEAEEFLVAEEEKRRAAARKRAGGMLGRMEIESTRERVEKGHVKGLGALRGE
jgi:histone H3/H4